MPLKILRNDITQMTVDAIVNAAAPSLLGGGGVDGCIHRAAGPELLAECRTLGGCATGQAKITGAYALPCRYVIHTVGPVWNGGGHNEKALLESCYRTSLALAQEHHCETVAFPLISSGAFGYPKDRALKVAVDVIGDFLLEHEITVFLVIFDKAAYQIGEKLFADIAEYIDDNYVEAHTDAFRESLRKLSSNSIPAIGDCGLPSAAAIEEDPDGQIDGVPLYRNAPKPSGAEDCGIILRQTKPAAGNLSQMLQQIDESFSQMLLRKIDEKGWTDAECYKRANIDRKLFSKIRSDVHYRPSKPTAIAFAVSLELSLSETEELLRKAGFALSHSNKFDIIIEYFISAGNYNIHEINEALFAFDQCLLGA